MQRKPTIALPTGTIGDTVEKRDRSRVTWHFAESDTTAGTTPDERDANEHLPTDPDPTPTESNDSILALLHRFDRTTSELRLPNLTKGIVRKLVRGLEQIAEWYTLEFLEAGGGAGRPTRNRKLVWRRNTAGGSSDGGRSGRWTGIFERSIW